MYESFFFSFIVYILQRPPHYIILYYYADDKCVFKEGLCSWYKPGSILPGSRYVLQTNWKFNIFSNMVSMCCEVFIWKILQRYFQIYNFSQESFGEKFRNSNIFFNHTSARLECCEICYKQTFKIICIL